jgi:hypothetical protein
MSHVRAKFKCSHFVQHAGYNGAQGSREYHFDAVCADEVDENKRFHKYTPSGKLSMYVDNHAVQFKPGKSYYIDFSPAA